MNRGTEETETDISEHSSASCSYSKVKLPKLEINKFNGDPAYWLSFWNQFENAIHQNSNLTDIDKFNYLHSLLIGSAANVVKGFSLSSSNYIASIELLKKRYGRKDLIINAHMGKLLNLEPVKNSNNTFALRKLYDSIEIQIRNLNSLAVTSGTYGTLLTPILLKLIPDDLNLEFQRKRKSQDNFEVNELIEFLRSEIECRETAIQIQNRINAQNSSYIQKEKKIIKNSFPTATALKVSIKQCIFCEESSENDNHISDDCPMSVADRKATARRKGFCFLCMKKGKHLAKNCFSKIKCEICGGKHNTLICDRNIKSEEKSKIENRQFTLTNKTCMQKVLLQTLVVRIRSNGIEKLIRCLIDTGSQKTYLSKYVAKVMKYKCISESSVIHSLFGGIEVSEKHKQYVVNVSNMQNDYHCNFKAFDQTKICSDIPQIEIKSYLNEIKKYDIRLSDVGNMKEKILFESDPSEIHLLIGADIAGKLLTGRIKKLECGLTCVETYLGWTVMGKIPLEPDNTPDFPLTFSMHVSECKISELWNLDTLGILDPSERENKRELEEQTLQHFRSTVKKDSEGRYEVSLPWIEGHPKLPDNRGIAEKRLKHTVKNLKEKGFLSDYETVLKSWVDEKIIEVVPEKEYDISGHYLPHRAVIRMNSKTSKIRPVFDGSARFKGSPSINDCLYKGPNLIETVPAIINRFRIKKIGVSADIKKAFLQIGLNPNDRDYLKFLWWEHGNPNNLKIYRHRRVVFGLTCSPYLLGATLQYHLKDTPEHFRETATKLAESFYVDNCVTSLEDEEKLHQFISESKNLLNTAQFDLRGWEHNDINSQLEKNVPSDKRNIPILGLVWELSSDSLAIDLREDTPNNNILSKRKILSVVHRVFDPIGYTCPVTLRPKIMLQECWKLKITWDAELPTDIGKKFEKWQNQLHYLKDISIPRCLIDDPDTSKNLSLHIFCDASKVAYATCIFLRSENETSTSCQLIQARSRVAPLKSITIPRLELLACTIGARLAQSVVSDLRLQSLPIFFWTDSANALYWIKRNENWAPFVYNRVQEIRTISNPEDWNYVPGSLNSADLPSRGCSAEYLKRSHWWEGPNWLRESQKYWPKEIINPDSEVVNSERKRIIVTATDILLESIDFFGNCSSYKKMLRVTAWILRFAENAKKTKETRILTKLTVEEINKAELTILKFVQNQCFSKESEKEISALHTFIDEKGIIRVKTRISMRKDLEEFRFPIILPANHNVTSRIISEKHVEMNHAGVQILMSALREKFWIIKCRKTIRKVVQKCVRCKRFSAKTAKVLSPPLPEDRVQDASVFEITGTDLCGPLYLKDGQKCWIVLYTCAVFRAVHLELTTSLSTESFIQTLRRFISRRGRPHVVYSDNGTNLVATGKELNSLDWKQVEEYATTNRIKWKFNPPAAPWWGGFWERLIRIIKSILKRILGKAHLDYEELYTIICDTESIVNARPLTYISEDPNDLTPLTPEMFLKDIRESGVPDLDFIDKNKLKKRFVYRQKLKDDLRKRFRNEYLGSLREFSFIKQSTVVKEGDLVLVRDDNLKRIQWPMAKVIQLYPGRDGHFRVAKLKTQNGELVRPLQRLCPLELSDKEATDLPLRHTKRGREIKPVQRLSA